MIQLTISLQAIDQRVAWACSQKQEQAQRSASSCGGHPTAAQSQVLGAGQAAVFRDKCASLNAASMGAFRAMAPDHWRMCNNAEAAVLSQHGGDRQTQAMRA